MFSKTISIKVVLLLLVLLLLSGTEVFSASALKRIRSLYYKTEKDIDTYKKRSVHLNEFDIYTAWVDGKEIKKIFLMIPDRWIENSMYRIKTNYYFHKNKLFFVFRSSEKINRKNSQKVDLRKEERIYIDKNMVLKALVRETDKNSFNGVPNRNYKLFLKDRKKQKSLLDDAKQAFRAVQNNI